LRTLIFKAWFWIYFSPCIYYVLIDYRLLNRQWYIQWNHYDYNKFNYW
jgi:hypothetical protein